MQSTSQSAQAESDLFDDDDEEDEDHVPISGAAHTSTQHLRSRSKAPLVVRALARSADVR